MAVLITGGYGLIGSELAKTLIEKGENVWLLDKWIAPPASAFKLQARPAGDGIPRPIPGSHL